MNSSSSFTAQNLYKHKEILESEIDKLKDSIIDWKKLKIDSKTIGSLRKMLLALKEEHKLILNTIENALKFTLDFPSSPSLQLTSNSIYSDDNDNREHYHDNYLAPAHSNLREEYCLLSNDCKNHHHHHHDRYDDDDFNANNAKDNFDSYKKYKMESLGKATNSYPIDTEMTFIENMSIDSKDYLIRYGLLNSSSSPSLYFSSQEEKMKNEKEMKKNEKNQDYYILNNSEFHRIRQHLHKRNLNSNSNSNNRNLFD